MEKTQKRKIGNKFLFKEDMKKIKKVLDKYNKKYRIVVLISVNSENIEVQYDEFNEAINEYKKADEIKIELYKDEFSRSKFYTLQIRRYFPIGNIRWFSKCKYNTKDKELYNDIILINNDFETIGNYIFTNIYAYATFSLYLIIELLLLLINYKNHFTIWLWASLGAFLIYSSIIGTFDIFKNIERENGFKAKHFVDIIIAFIFFIIGFVSNYLMSYLLK